jgi:hypothetical protein
LYANVHEVPLGAAEILQPPFKVGRKRPRRKGCWAIRERELSVASDS